MDVARQGHAHEVGHHAARRQEPERACTEAEEVAQPADDLLLHEGGDRPGMPDIDALVGHLREQFAHHRDRQWRRCEVAELARVLGVHLPARQARPELVEDGFGRGGGDGRRRRSAEGPVERSAHCLIVGRLAHRAVHRRAVEEVQSGPPSRLAEGLEGRPGGTRIAVADQFRFGVPVEAGEVGLEVGWRRRVGSPGGSAARHRSSNSTVARRRRRTVSSRTSGRE